MPRELTSHRVNPLNRAIVITAHDNGVYGMTLPVVTHDRDGAVGFGHETCAIRFQDGPTTTPDGFNGFTVEALLAICEDKLQQYQSGSFACRENACALTHLQECMMWLGKRTRDREQRGVEGTLVK